MRIRQLLFCCISLMMAACEISPAEEPKIPEQPEEPKTVFAKGAVSAAVFLAGKPAGFYDMSNVIEESLK